MPTRHDPHSGTAHAPGKVSRRKAEAACAQLAAGGLSHQERRRLRSVTVAKEAASEHRKVKFRRVTIIALGAIAAMAVVAAAFHLVPAINAARGQGTKGTFVYESSSCTRRMGCTTLGNFQAADGIVIPNVAYDGTLPANTVPGSGVAARYTGSGQTYPAGGSHYWIPVVLLMIVFGGAAAFLLWVSPLGLRGNRPTTS